MILLDGDLKPAQTPPRTVEKAVETIQYVDGTVVHRYADGRVARVFFNGMIQFTDATGKRAIVQM
jgi:hypothetical protein